MIRSMLGQKIILDKLELLFYKYTNVSLSCGK